MIFLEVLKPATKTLLVKLEPPHLPPNSYLGGGTAIALQLGHRRSLDLDFFTPREFTEIQWGEKLKKELNFKLLKRDWQTLIGTVGGIKISLLGYTPKLIRPAEEFFNLPVASLPDLAAMKLETAIDRGTKRDFIDLYFLAQKYTLAGLFDFYQEKYGLLEERELMIKKGLAYFADADKEEMPEMLVEVNWGKIKKWFLEEIRNL